MHPPAREQGDPRVALLGFESFDAVGTETDLITGPFTSAVNRANFPATLTATNARGGVGQCVLMSGGGGTANQFGVLSRAYGETITTAIGGIAVLIPSGGSTIIVLGHLNAGTWQTHLEIDVNGVLTAWRGAPGAGILLGTSSTPIRFNVWTYIELLTTASVSVGVLQVQIAGVLALSLSGIDTSADSTTNITRFSAGSYVTENGVVGPLAYFDDLYIADTTGGAPYDTFLGSQHAASIAPTANAAVTWTPLTPPNWQEVSNVWNGDSDFNAAQAIGLIDLFTSAGLGFTPASITAVQIKLSARRIGSTITGLAPQLKSASTDATGSTFSPATSYAYNSQVFVEDPAVSGAWTATAVNTLKFGYNRIS